MCIAFWKFKADKAESKPALEQIDQEGKIEERSPIMKQEVIVVEPVIEEESINEPVEDVVIVVEDKKEVIQKYHVSQNKNKDAENFLKWRVRKESSMKTIQFFDTQKEAIDYAQGLADRAGSTVVIHKLDGSIRKQDYTKKAK